MGVLGSVFLPSYNILPAAKAQHCQVCPVRSLDVVGNDFSR